MVLLDEQGEQINRIEEGTDNINQGMKEAEKNLKNLEKCCGCCVLPWQSSKNFERSSDYKDTWKSKGGSGNGQTVTDGPDRKIDANAVGAVSGRGLVNRITDDAREDEMDENLAQVSGILGNLKVLSVDMGNEIERQTGQLDRINNKVNIFFISESFFMFAIHF